MSSKIELLGISTIQITNNEKKKKSKLTANLHAGSNYGDRVTYSNIVPFENCSF